MIWTVLGISVAIIAVFCVSLAETVVGHPIFENHRLHIAVALALPGAVLAVLAWIVSVRRKAMDFDDTKTFILFDLRFWGPMLIVFGAITVFIRPLKEMKAEIASIPVNAAPKPVLVETQAVSATAKRPVIFPKVRIQGIFFQASRAAAILNGESYAVGDWVGKARVKAIDRNGVLLEIAGETKLLTLN
jgi:hypothetical protein